MRGRPAVSARVRGREAELERIGARVRGSGGGMVVVCGAGGLGKTTLAAEAAAQARAQGQVVVWIRWRDDPEQLGQDLAQAAHILGLPESRLEEARMGRVSLVDAVWKHLADVTGWLIVIDNVDTPARVGPGSGPPAAYRGWLRPHGGGVLLVTSRDTTRQTWGPDADLIHLQPLADDAGGAVLLDAAPHAGTEAEALAARLGGLPLALNAAGTYLSVPTSRHRTFTAYQHALEAEFGDLLGAEHPGAAADPAVARRVVRHTWDISFDQLHRDGYTLARPVLQLLALLEPAPIPRTLMTPELVTDATGLPATAAGVDAALAGLHQYGLLHTPETDEPEPDSPTVGRLQLHPLVPAFRKPKSKNAATTLAMMGLLAVTMFCGIIALAMTTDVKMAENPAVDLLRDGVPVGESYTQDPVIAQVAEAVFGHGSFLFMMLAAATALVLFLAANTAYNGFPLLGSILAQDRYLPRQLHTRGDRLAFSNGIVLLPGGRPLDVRPRRTARARLGVGRREAGRVPGTAAASPVHERPASPRRPAIRGEPVGSADSLTAVRDDIGRGASPDPFAIDVFHGDHRRSARDVTARPAPVLPTPPTLERLAACAEAA
ncbi:AAA family ATPase, partial [Streptomyces halstedii]|uniref:AAA family ATPase n=1 Tax=Streptomyces halstedii TaxID=1944 RepID=UPI0033B11B95